MARTRPILAARIVVAVATTAIPIAILGTLVHQGQRDVLDAAQRQRQGVEYSGAVVSLADALGQHRLAQLMCRMDAPDCASVTAESRARLTVALATLRASHDAHARSLGLDPALFAHRGIPGAHPDALAVRLEGVLAPDPEHTDPGDDTVVAQGFDERDEFSEELLGTLAGVSDEDPVRDLHADVLNLLRLVADRSGMLHEPEADGYQLAVLVGQLYPELQFDLVSLAPLRATPSFGGSAESAVVAQFVDGRDRRSTAWAFASIRGAGELDRTPRHAALLTRAEALDGEVHAFALDVPAFDDTERLEYVRRARVLLTRLQATWSGSLAAFADTLDRRVEQTRAEQENILRVTSVVVFIVLLLVVLVLRAMHKPLRALMQAAASIRDGDLSARAPGAARRDELGALAQAFNTMAAAVDERERALQGHAAELEDVISDRTAAMQAMLDASDQGLLVIDEDGKLRPERSRAVARYFGEPPDQDIAAADFLAPNDPDWRDMLALGLEDLRDDVMPAEVVLAQMPGRLVRDGRSYAVRYAHINDGAAATGRSARILVTIDDTTDDDARARAERIQRELPALISALVRDRPGFAAFVDSCEALLASLVNAQAERTTRIHALHTLKGDTALYGMTSFAAECHALESAISEANGTIPESHCARLPEHFRATLLPIDELLRDVTRGVVTLLPAELRSFVHQLQAGHEREDLVETVAAWQRTPLAQVLAPAAAAVERLGRTLGKSVRVDLDLGGLRIPTESLRPFVVSLVHVLRNAVDHGLEAPEDRAAAGKPAEGTIRVSARATDDLWELTIADDGAGIDWDALQARASALGLPSGRAAAIDALFADGCSTRTEVTDISGRGLGLGAVRALCEERGGTVAVHSEPATGTRFTFSFRVDKYAAVRAQYPSLYPSTPPAPPPAVAPPQSLAERATTTRLGAAFGSSPEARNS